MPRRTRSLAPSFHVEGTSIPQQPEWWVIGHPDRTGASMDSARAEPGSRVGTAVKVGDERLGNRRGVVTVSRARLLTL